jgi:drug/metabolite transporter (DMT)-like permease
MSLYMIPVGLVPALFVWQWPSPHALALVGLLGVFATIAHQCYTRALATCDASYVLPIEFARLPISALLAFAAFSEMPDLWTVVGGAVIFASTIYIARRESQIAKREAGAVPPPP